jgi:hypothetical protein
MEVAYLAWKPRLPRWPSEFVRRLTRSFSSWLAEKCLAARSVRLFWNDAAKTLPASRTTWDIHYELRKTTRANEQESLYVVHRKRVAPAKRK